MSDKRITSVYLSQSLVEEAKKKFGINLSQFVTNALIEYIGKQEVYEDTIPVLLEDEIKKFTEVARRNNEWEKFAVARSRLVQNKTGIFLTPQKLIHLVRKELGAKNE